LLTIHRASNVDNLDNLRKIIIAVIESGEKIIFPIHPRTRKQFEKLKIHKFENIKIINPVSYFDMLVLEKNAKKIVTDSGGVQKEAYWLKVPCVTLRENTEWVETIKTGWNSLVGINRNKILRAIKEPNLKMKRYIFSDNGKSIFKIIKIIENAGQNKI
jgi:UDP-N-acetylglucosamine 2-epimerase (non-hydrolysing)